MRTSIFATCLAVVVLALVLAAPTGAVPIPDISLDLSPYPDYYGGETLEVPPGDVEPLWIHFDFDYYFDLSFEDEWQIADIQVLSDVIQGSGSVVPGPWIDLVPGRPESSVWYHLCDITVNGEPSTMIDISVDITFVSSMGDVFPISSNKIHKHITPEPSSLLALGTGVFGIGGILLRRRRS